MMTDRRQAIETADFIGSRISRIPRIGLLAGTGLSDSLRDLEPDTRLDYSELPHFPMPTVESHRGKLVCGSLAGASLIMMQGRFHLYEGYSPAQICFPVRVMQELGVRTLILTNAAGGLNLGFSPGDIMIIRDHVNLTGKNPLTGPNEDAWGLRFPDMSQVWDPGLISLAGNIFISLGLALRTGVYAGLPGPSLETPAENRFLKAIGCDAVGFSTVIEAIAGTHAGMRILGLSLITNINDPDAPARTTLESVLQTARQSLEPFGRLLGGIIAGISADAG